MVTIVIDHIEAISSNMFSQHNCPHLKDNHVMHVYIIMLLLLEEIDYLGTTDKILSVLLEYFRNHVEIKCSSNSPQIY